LLAGSDGFVEGGTGLTGCREKVRRNFGKLHCGCVLCETRGRVRLDGLSS